MRHQSERDQKSGRRCHKLRHLTLTFRTTTLNNFHQLFNDDCNFTIYLLIANWVTKFYLLKIRVNWYELHEPIRPLRTDVT